jgi:hypothetical protein
LEYKQLWRHCHLAFCRELFATFGQTLPCKVLLRTLLCNRVCNHKIVCNRERETAMASLVKIWVVCYVDDQGRRVSKNTSGAKKVKERSTNWYGQYKFAGRVVPPASRPGGRRVSG